MHHSSNLNKGATTMENTPNNVPDMRTLSLINSTVRLAKKNLSKSLFYFLCGLVVAMIAFLTMVYVEIGDIQSLSNNPELTREIFGITAFDFSLLTFCLAALIFAFASGKLVWRSMDHIRDIKTLHPQK